MTDRRIGGADLTVDIRPVEAKERQLGSGVLQVDVRVPQGIQYGSALLSIEVTTNPARGLGNVGLMVDYVESLVDAVTWSGSAFGIGGAFPDVHWSAGKFQSASGPRVLWDATAGTFTLEGA